MEYIELNKYTLKNNVNGNFACEASGNGEICVVTDVNVVVMKYKCDMENEINSFTFDKYTIVLSDYHIANQTGGGININEQINFLPRERFFRIVRNDIFSPELENANPQVTKPLSATWSPVGVFRKTDAVLATVSNTGNVEIFYGMSYDFKCFANLADCWINEMKRRWKETRTENLSPVAKSNLHEERVLECLALCASWSSIYTFDDERFCFIAVGHASGTVSIWRVECTDNFDQNTKIDLPILMGYFDTGFKKIVALNWCTVSENSAWVIVGNQDGVTRAIFIDFVNSQQFEIKNKLDVWADGDIKVGKIFSFTEDGSSCFLIVKNSFIVLTLVDNDERTLKWTGPINFGNLFITGILPIEQDKFIVCSFTGIIKALEIKILKNLCTYDVRDIKTDINWDVFAIHGVTKLLNGHVWGVLKYPCKIIDHLTQRNPIEISFCIKKDLDPEKVLKENPTRHLHGYWELMDIIRCLASKSDLLPCSCLTSVEKYDEISFYELRIIYWLTQASYKFLLLHSKVRKTISKFPPPDTLEKILIYRYHFERLKYTLKLHESKEMLPIYLLYSIYMLKHGLLTLFDDRYVKEYFSEKFHEEVKETIEKVIGLETLPTPICVACETKFKNGQCPNMHLDDRCVITNVQTKGFSRWNCPMCQKMAHNDLDEDDPFCPLCDVPLLHYDPGSDQYRSDV